MNYQNWKEKPNQLYCLLEQSIAQNKKATIYTVLDHVSRSGLTRYISAYIILDNIPYCIAREYKVTGGGMDMGYHLAYTLFLDAYYNGNGHFKPEDRPYQKYLSHHWL